MAKLTLNDVTSGYLSSTLYNANNTSIETAVENTLSRDGTSPNQMEAVIDMNSNKITNLAQGTNNSDAVTVLQCSNINGAGGAVNIGDLADVNITAAATGDVLRYDGTEWVDYPDSNYVTSPSGSDTHIQFNDSGLFGASVNLTWSDTQLAITNTTSSDAALQINLGNNPSTGIEFQSTLNAEYTPHIYYDNNGTNWFRWIHHYANSTPNHRLSLESSWAGATLFEIENEGQIWIGGGENLAPLAVLPSVGVRVESNHTFFIEETAAAASDSAGFGQLWVKNDTPTTLMFTTDDGEDQEVNMLRTATTTELNDISHAINTNPFKKAGAMVFNTTSNKPVWAVGDTDGAVWVDATGITAHTPA